MFLLTWADSFLIKISELIQGWTTAWTLLFYSIRMTSLVGTQVFTWWIIFHSPTSMQRKISAVGLAFCALLAGLWSSCCFYYSPVLHKRILPCWQSCPRNKNGHILPPVCPAFHVAQDPASIFQVSWPGFHHPHLEQQIP